MVQILIGIYDKIYDVTKYISKHPGEGIGSTFIKQYNRKDCTSVFEKFHMTNEPDELLISANNNDNDYIKYICPFYNFSKINRIPKYFFYFNLEESVEEFFEDKENNSYILRNSKRANTLILTYKDQIIYNLVLERKENNKWETFFNDNKITKDYVVEIIKEILPNFKEIN